MGVHCALCEKWAIFDPFPPMAKVTAVATVIPYTGLLRFFFSPKTQIMSQTDLCFALKMPDCCLNPVFFACGHMLPRWWVVFRVVTGKQIYCWALCRAVQRRPQWIPVGQSSTSGHPEEGHEPLGYLQSGVVYHACSAPHTCVSCCSTFACSHSIECEGV